VAPESDARFEGLDAMAELDAFEVAEASAQRHLRIPVWARRGIDAGRLRMGRTSARLVFRRLAYRTGTPSYVVLRNVGSGEVVRLPFH
jgi:hypothetical protein